VLDVNTDNLAFGIDVDYDAVPESALGREFRSMYSESVSQSWFSFIIDPDK